MNGEEAYGLLKPYLSAAAYFTVISMNAVAEQLEGDDDAFKTELLERVAKGEDYGWQSMAPDAHKHPWRTEMQEELLDAVLYEAIRLRAESVASP